MRARSWLAEAQMTSSYRATGHASVRVTPATHLTPAGAWALDELVLPHAAAAQAAKPAAVPQISAEEKARLIDEGYARGLRDGEAKARSTAQATIDDTVIILGSAAAQLTELAAIAPGALEENIAALATVVARQIVQREVAQDRELVANLVRRALTEFPIDQTVRIRVN